MAGQVVGEMVGAVLGGRYVLRAFLGAGASAQVYLADDTHLRRRVAVKVLHPVLAADAAFLRRFAREAVAAAGLDHPHLLAVYDHFPGSATEPPYLVTPYMEGGSLRAVLDAGGRLSRSQACLVGMEAASGLAAAHGKGLVHRDVKPANLLFDATGRLRVGDFGLARAIAEGAATEPAGAVVGTARYAAPEQAGGGSVDDRADVYALALVLVEAVTGSVPFARDTVLATLTARLRGSLEPPEAMGPLAETIRRAGQVDPADRASAGEVLALLEQAARQLPRPAPLALPPPLRLDPLRLDPLRPGPADPWGGPEDVDAAGLDRAGLDRAGLDRDDDITLLAPAGPVRADPVRAHPDRSHPDRTHPDRTTQRSTLRSRGDRRVGRRRVLAVLAVLLAAGGGGAAWLLSRESPVPVPAVVGLAESAAVSALEESGLSAEVRRRVDEEAAVGMVTAQDPPAGGSASSGSVVVLTVSQGPAPRRVPDLSGLDADAAAAALAGVQLRPGSVSRVSDEAVPAGTVLRWAPTGEVPRGSAVDLVLSDGPAPRIVPNISGMTPDEAKAALPEGLTAEVVEVYSDSVPEGTVVSANYRPGASVARGTVIRIRVSKGPELLVVPDVSGRTVGRATALLKDAGFDVVGVDGPPDGTVRRTDPVAGRSLPRGSDVRLVTA